MTDKRILLGTGKNAYKKSLKLFKSDNIRYLPFLIPGLLVYTVFVCYPIINSFYYALTDWNGLGKGIHFIGIKNFTNIIFDDRFVNAAINTLKWLIIDLVFANTIPLGMALLLNMKIIKTRNLLRTVFYIPVVISFVVVGFVWVYILNYDFGIINQVLDFLVLRFMKQDWIGNPNIALYTLFFVALWQGVSSLMLIYLAGLQDIPIELYEAANIDGVNMFTRFRCITLPLLAPAITVVTILNSIYSLKTFDVVFVMTKGGPGYSTEVIATTIYYEAFGSYRFGYATAISVLLFLVIIAITSFQMKIFRRREVVL